MAHTLTLRTVEGYRTYLQENEKSPATVEKYLRDIRAMYGFLALGVAEERGGAERTAGRMAMQSEGVVAPAVDTQSPAAVLVDKTSLLAWREHLLRERTPGTVNGMLSAANGLFKYLDWEDCQVRFLKVQRRLFRDRRRQLTQPEYRRLLAAAEARGDERLRLLLETLCATGIRVSEVAYITLEAVRQGCAQIALKGKIRTVLLPGKLCRKLRQYAKARGISGGVIFRTRGGKPLARRQIWAQMKALCKAARVEPSKVFPHNLRHLFATVFYQACRDIVRLADVLGHSSVETTRIYLISTGEEQVKQLNRLGLVT